MTIQHRDWKMKAYVARAKFNMLFNGEELPPHGKPRPKRKPKYILPSQFLRD